MNEQTYNQEINLGKVIYRILRDWRSIFIIALSIALLTGAGNLVLKKIKISNTEYITTAEENYNRELTAFYARGETLEREIANLEETREERETYNANSVLMKINPYREYNASLQLYVSTDYQIVPELTYQNIDLSNRILRSYITYMVNGDMYQYIMDNISKPIELRYLKEILSISGDYDNRMVTLSVRGEDKQSCEEILDYALSGILAKQREIADAIGEHEIVSVNQSVYETVNLELDEWQKGNLQYVSELSIRLQEKAEEYAVWEASPEPGREFTDRAVVRDSVKKMILGFLVGAVFAAVFIAFRYIMSDKLQDAGELKNRFGLRVVAQVPGVHKKRVWVGFDRLFSRMGGLVLCERDAATLAKVAGESVKAEMMMLERSVSVSEKTKAAGESPITLIFTGSIETSEMEKLVSLMDWQDSYSVRCVPNILSDPTAVLTVMEADYVVLVEKQEESVCSQVERELSELAAWKKKVLGFIVIGVDAVP